MLQRYWLIGVNGISTLFRLAPWGLVSKPFFFFFKWQPCVKLPYTEPIPQSLIRPYGIHHQCIHLQLERENEG